MKRILFIDDESAVLRALERALRGQRHEWECQFVDDPMAGLDVIDAFQPNAVVSDMLMPGLDGAEFLTEAAHRQPVMARMILSGEVGAGSLARMAAVAHRCLAKPCRAEVLTDVLRGALPDSDGGRPLALQHGLYALTGLPVSPDALNALRRVLVGPPSAARDDEALRVISSAPGVATKLLQVAAWTSLGSGRTPVRVREAYHQLGVDAILSLLDSEMFAPAAPPHRTAFQSEAWRHCERATAAAAAVAAAEGCDQQATDGIVMVTLMAATTPLLLDTLSPGDFDAVREDASAAGRTRAAVEAQWFGLPGAHFTARLMRLWGLPADVASLVAAGDDVAALSAGVLAPDVVSYVVRTLTDPQAGVIPHDLAGLAARLDAGARFRAWEDIVSTAIQ